MTSTDLPDYDRVLFCYEHVINGFTKENVYSTEEENILYMHPAILEMAVIGVPDEKWGEAVKAIVILKEGDKATEEEIIAFCRDNIAHYKAPKSVDFINELPKRGSGKIYKKRLQDQSWGGRGKRSRDKN